MQLLIILIGIFVIIVGLFKQITKISIGYQLIQVPGIFTATLGFFIVLLGILWP